MIAFPWSLYSDTIFLCCGNTKYLEIIKRRSKLQKNHMLCERTLNHDHWKPFFKNYKPMRIWLWLVYKFTDNYCRLSQLFPRVHSNSKEVSYVSWQNTYLNLKTTCHIKLKFFLRTILLENLLVAKYLISVTAPLSFDNDEELIEHYISYH